MSYYDKYKIEIFEIINEDETAGKPRHMFNF